ncbi:MAG: hypothetical protein KDC98_01210 [Planctomycetes bacterium]|nr:hypothetical protein [Planctomycetota bacterium]
MTNRFLPLFSLTCGVFVSCLGKELPSQCYLRGWGAYGYDTESNLGRMVQVEAEFISTIIRRSDGYLFASGGAAGQMFPPDPPQGLSYVDCDISGSLGIGLLSNGQAVTWNWYFDPTTYLPPALPPGVTFVDVAAGYTHLVCLRSDGEIEVFGNFNLAANLANVPPLPAGMTYTKVESGTAHALALRSDGALVAWGDNSNGQCNVPQLPPGVSYVAVDASGGHTVALRSDGEIAAFGYNMDGQCNVPPLPLGMTYVDVAAGGRHTVAIRSDGAILCWGWNAKGQCNSPPIPAGLSVVSVSAGTQHSVALLIERQGPGLGQQVIHGTQPAGTARRRALGEGQPRAPLRHRPEFERRDPHVGRVGPVGVSGAGIAARHPLHGSRRRLDPLRCAAFRWPGHCLGQ